MFSVTFLYQLSICSHMMFLEAGAELEFFLFFLFWVWGGGTET